MHVHVYTHTNTHAFSLSLSLSLYCIGMDEMKLFLSFLVHACWGRGAQSLDDVGLHVFRSKKSSCIRHNPLTFRSMMVWLAELKCWATVFLRLWRMSARCSVKWVTRARAVSHIHRPAGLTSNQK